MTQFPDNLIQLDILKKAFDVYPDSVDLDVIDVNEFQNIMLLWDSGYIKIVDGFFEQFPRYAVFTYFDEYNGLGKATKLNVLITPLGVERITNER